jgi:hypothetical protein
VEEFLTQLDEEGFGPPARSIYFFWIDRYIIDRGDIEKNALDKFVRGMVDGRFVNKCEIYDFSEKQYLLVCRMSLNLYDVVFFLPNRNGYLAGMKYFMRVKGKIDMVSLRKLFNAFRINLSRSGSGS